MIHNQKRKVSVITGYYNREDFVTDSIKSLLNQTYENLEIVIFDDSSTDNTLKNIYTIVDGDRRVKVISFKKNVGFVNGLIKAIDSSTGEFIAIHGSGDISISDRISKQAEILTSNSATVLVSCFYVNIDKKNSIFKRVTPNKYISKDELLADNPFSHGEVMFRRSAYDISGGYRRVFTYCQDYDLWLRLINIGVFHTIQEVLYERIVNFTGVSYMPEKFIKQIKYKILAKNLAINTIDYSVLDNDLFNIDKLIPTSNRLVQGHLFLMFNVLTLKRDIKDFQFFIDNGSRRNKFYFSIVRYLYDKPLFKYLISFMYKFGLKLRDIAK